MDSPLQIPVRNARQQSESAAFPWTIGPAISVLQDNDPLYLVEPYSEAHMIKKSFVPFRLFMPNSSE